MSCPLWLSAQWATYSWDPERKVKGFFFFFFFFLIASSAPVLPLNYCRHPQFTLQMRPHKHWEQNHLYRIRLPAQSLMCVSFSNRKRIFPWDTFGKFSTRNQSCRQLHQPILHTPESSPYGRCAKVGCKKILSLLLKFGLSFFVSLLCDQLTCAASVSHRLKRGCKSTRWFPLCQTLSLASHQNLERSFGIPPVF